MTPSHRMNPMLLAAVAGSPLLEHRAAEIMTGAEEFDRLRTGRDRWVWLSPGLRHHGRQRHSVRRGTRLAGPLDPLAPWW